MQRAPVLELVLHIGSEQRSATEQESTELSERCDSSVRELHAPEAQHSVTEGGLPS